MFEVAWAHPKFGNLIASCGFDNRVIIWKEVQENVWSQVCRSQINTGERLYLQYYQCAMKINHQLPADLHVGRSHSICQQRVLCPT